MTTLARFTVLGVPSPQGSKKAFVRGGRAHLVESAGDKLTLWRDSVSAAAKACRDGQPPITIPVSVSITFRMPRPKSAPRRAVWAAKQPDVDKLARGVLDAMTVAGMIADDSLVVRLIAIKVLAPADQPWTGCMVTILDAADVHVEGAA